MLCFGEVVHHGPRSFSRHVPRNGGQAENLLDREVAFEQMKHSRFDLRFLAFAGQALSAKVDDLETDVAVAGQIVHGDAKGIGERDEDAGTWHGLVAFVLADRLGGDAVANSCFQTAERKAGGMSAYLNPLTDGHIWPSSMIDKTKILAKSVNYRDRNSAPSSRGQQHVLPVNRVRNAAPRQSPR